MTGNDAQQHLLLIFLDLSEGYNQKKEFEFENARKSFQGSFNVTFLQQREKLIFYNKK